QPLAMPLVPGLELDPATGQDGHVGRHRMRSRVIRRGRVPPPGFGSRPLRIASYLGSAKVSGSTLARTLNSVISEIRNRCPSRFLSTLVAFLIPSKSL